MDRLPPLNAVRAFEAAARHMSITLAADELNVTPGAVSRQIRAYTPFAMRWLIAARGADAAAAVRAAAGRCPARR